jgi:hypothetical protein
VINLIEDVQSKKEQNWGSGANALNQVVGAYAIAVF